jgi:hypothetical protein
MDGGGDLRVGLGRSRLRWGMTIRYDAGPKQGLAVHFYARDELADLI